MSYGELEASLVRENRELREQNRVLRELVEALPLLNVPVVVCLNGNWVVKSTDHPLKYTYKFESQQTAVAFCKLFRYRAALTATSQEGQG